jgi:hypothetical protein
VDDRPDENKSFAAQNLVKPGLASRARQQSEPPINRNAFPPTPPPEADKPLPLNVGKDGSSIAGSASSGGSAGGMSSRAASVRSGDGRQREMLRQRNEAASMDRPRLGNVRSASEQPRGPSRQPSRGQSRVRRMDTVQDVRSPPRRRSDEFDDEEERDSYPDDLYDMYNGDRRSQTSARQEPRRQASSRSQRPMYIAEEDEEEYDDEFGGDSLDEEDEFEMMSQRAPSVRRRGTSRAPSRQPDIRKVRYTLPEPHLSLELQN